MTEKEKLVEIIQNSVGGCARNWAEVIADGLIANGVTIQKWISVEESLPEDEGIVLVCGSRKGIYTAEFRRNGNYHWFHKLNSKCHHCDPTHWMHLPEPPKGE